MWSWFASHISGIVDWIVSGFMSLVGPIAWITEWAWSEIVQAWEYAVAAGETGVQSLLGAVPTGIVPDFSPVLGGLGDVNHWLPVAESLTMLFAMWAFVLAFSVTKFVLKLIPFIG